MQAKPCLPSPHVLPLPTAGARAKRKSQKTTILSAFFSALAASATGVVSITATSPNPFLIIKEEKGLGLGVLNKHRLIANHFRTVDVSPLSVAT